MIDLFDSRFREFNAEWGVAEDPLCQKVKGYPVFIIYGMGSSTLSPTRITDILKDTGYYPIIGQNRLGGCPRFTLCPYVPGSLFDLEKVRGSPLDVVSLREKIESIPSAITADTVAKRVLFIEHCRRAASFVVDWMEAHPDFRGSVLDIGSGRGTNSIPLLKQGAQVLAIDACPEAEEAYKAEAGRALARDRLTFITTDATTCPFEERGPFDLVICTDVLPYISPKNLYGLVERIAKVLLPGGQFIGTLFFSPAVIISPSPAEELNTSRDAAAQEYGRKQGCHFYREPQVALSLLHAVGLEVENIAYDIDLTSDKMKSLMSDCVQFIARKPE